MKEFAIKKNDAGQRLDRWLGKTPAGTTIEAVRVLEGTGFRSSVIEAMKACTDIAKGM